MLEYGRNGIQEAFTTNVTFGCLHMSVEQRPATGHSS